jgi:hypothetical protein
MLAALLALAGLLLMAGSASAKDRNHDGLPDRWEKRHHLSLHVNQARKDQDRDGLRNKAEFLAGDNPRKADSDGDGIKDGAEHTGTVLSFTGGVLKVTVFGQSDPLVGQVTDQTEIECDDSSSSSTARASSDGSSSDDGPGDGESGDDQSGDTGDTGDSNDQGDDTDDQGDDDSAQSPSCGTAQLVPGAKVKEAELSVQGGNAVFDKVELQP